MPDLAETARVDTLARRVNRRLRDRHPGGSRVLPVYSPGVPGRSRAVARRHVRPGLWRGERLLPARPPPRLAERGRTGGIRRACRRTFVRHGGAASAGAQRSSAGAAASRLRRIDHGARGSGPAGGGTEAPGPRTLARGAATRRRGGGADHARCGRRSRAPDRRHRSSRIATADTAPSCCAPRGLRTVDDASLSATAPRTHTPICVSRCRANCGQVQRLLARERVRAIELHHLVGHHPSVLEVIAYLQVPYDLHVHDYAWLCGRVALVGAAERYCGEPDVAQCEACVANAGNLIDEDISVAALRRRSARLMAGARRVIAPSEDAAARIRRHFPAVRPTVQPHEDDAALGKPPFSNVGECEPYLRGWRDRCPQGLPGDP